MKFSNSTKIENSQSNKKAQTDLSPGLPHLVLDDNAKNDVYPVAVACCF
jgi:hypothetical protein